MFPLIQIEVVLLEHQDSQQKPVKQVVKEKEPFNSSTQNMKDIDMDNPFEPDFNSEFDSQTFPTGEVVCG